jgi:hypothetical protein
MTTEKPESGPTAWWLTEQPSAAARSHWPGSSRTERCGADGVWHDAHLMYTLATDPGWQEVTEAEVNEWLGITKRGEMATEGSGTGLVSRSNDTRDSSRASGDEPGSLYDETNDPDSDWYVLPLALPKDRSWREVAKADVEYWLMTDGSGPRDRQLAEMIDRLDGVTTVTWTEDGRAVGV